MTNIIEDFHESLTARDNRIRQLMVQASALRSEVDGLKEQIENLKNGKDGKNRIGSAPE